MAEKLAPKRLSKVAKELNVATTTIIDFLASKNIDVDSSPNTKLDHEYVLLLEEKFKSDKLEREFAEEKKQKEKAEKQKAGIDNNANGTDEMLIKTNIVREPLISKKDLASKPVRPVKKETPVKPAKKAEEKEIKKPKPKPKKEIKKPEPEKTTVKEKKEKKSEIPEEIPEEKPVVKPKEKKEEKKSVKKKELAEKEEKKPEKPEDKKEVKPPSEIIKSRKEEKKTEEKPVPKPEEEKKSVKKKELAEKEEKKPEKPEDEKEVKPEEKVLPGKEDKSKDDLQGLKILGTIDIDKFQKDKKKPKPVASTSDPSSIRKRRRRKVLKKDKQTGTGDKHKSRSKPKQKEEPKEKEIKDQISATLAKLTAKQQGIPTGRAKIRRKKKLEQKERAEKEGLGIQDIKKLEVIEFITANELANLMDVSVTEVITACMNLGLMVNINQRLDAETITIVADEFGFDVEFRQEAMDEPELEEEDNEDRIIERPPVVTIMGHVDHGKTSLLDFIRKTRIIEQEAGGITQHIGAYEVDIDGSGKKIVFLDTPGHEAFTSMRARGAKATDIVVVVVAADDSVMPQTKEAISHAQAAGVPIVFAINKIDKDGANPERIKEQLSEMNILVEEWGGKYQCEEISAKKGLNIDALLEKILLEAEMLELKADPEKRGIGTVIEATLDKGKGISTNVLIQSGRLRIGDPVLAGAYYGKVKAMINEKGEKLKEAGPSTPVEILGFDGAPTAGDKFYVTETEQQAKEIATKRKRLLREQGIRATKHVTLDEIGRRIALGSFKELNLIIKGDVDGSVEALTDSLQKLSSEEIQVNIIHKGVGLISESDVLLASASDAVIIGFQVRPSLNARKMAEKEQIDIRTYTVIYDAIEELKLAIEGMLEPTVEEKIVCNVEVRNVFKISKTGTVAGCMVLDGRITRNTKIRVLREGVVVYTGDISSLKRFKEDVKDVNTGYECGISIQNFNDVKVGDILEGFVVEEVKRKL